MLGILPNLPLSNRVKKPFWEIIFKTRNWIIPFLWMLPVGHLGKECDEIVWGRLSLVDLGLSLLLLISRKEIKCYCTCIRPVSSSYLRYFMYNIIKLGRAPLTRVFEPTMHLDIFFPILRRPTSLPQWRAWSPSYLSSNLDEDLYVRASLLLYTTRSNFCPLRSHVTSQ